MEEEIQYTAPAGTSEHPSEHLQVRLSTEEPSPAPKGLPTELVLRVLQHADQNLLARMARTNSTYHKEATKLLYGNLVFYDKGLCGSLDQVQAAMRGLYNFCSAYYSDGAARPVNLTPSVHANFWSWVQLRSDIYQATLHRRHPTLHRYIESVLSVTIDMPAPVPSTHPNCANQGVIFMPNSMELPSSLKQLCLRQVRTEIFDRSEYASFQPSAEELRMFPTSLSSLKLPEVVWLAEDGSLWPHAAPSPTHLEVLEVTTSARWCSGSMASGTIDQVFALFQLRELVLGASWKTRGLGLGRLLMLPMLETLSLGTFDICNASPDAVDHTNDLEEILAGSHARLRMLTITIRVGTGSATQAQRSLITGLGSLAEDKGRWPSLDRVEVMNVGQIYEANDGEASEQEAEGNGDDFKGDEAEVA